MNLAHIRMDRRTIANKKKRRVASKILLFFEKQVKTTGAHRVKNIVR